MMNKSQGKNVILKVSHSIISPAISLIRNAEVILGGIKAWCIGSAVDINIPIIIRTIIIIIISAPCGL